MVGDLVGYSLGKMVPVDFIAEESIGFTVGDTIIDSYTLSCYRGLMIRDHFTDSGFANYTLAHNHRNPSSESHYPSPNTYSLSKTTYKAVLEPDFVLGLCTHHNCHHRLRTSG